MKHFLIVASATLTFFLGGLFEASAQRYNSGIEFAPGYAQEGFGFKASYDYFHNRTDFLQASVLATFSKDKIHDGMKVNYNNYLLNFSYFTPVLKSRNNAINLFVGAGPLLGFERINQGEKDLDDNSLLLSEGGFIYGLTSGINAEYFLNDSLSLYAPIDFFYHLGSDLGNFHFFSGIGIKYYLN